MLPFVLLRGSAHYCSRALVVSSRLYHLCEWILEYVLVCDWRELRFSLVWLTVMALFPLSLLLLKYNCRHLKRETRASLLIIVLALLIVCVSIAGNIAVDPRTFGWVYFDNFCSVIDRRLNRYFSAYFIGITSFFFLTQHKSSFLKCLYWTIDQYPPLQIWGWTARWGASLVNAITRVRRKPVCILTKGDEVGSAFSLCTGNSHRAKFSRSINLFVW